ncbi:U3 small nucleolar RNA-associated protein 15, C-terminal [Dillenia turbinata]|uniref:U3 small nucleolar RNA-associated protein 15, C-terminal n=1 Tax=Dillenia turbinata TaxID=194707 RepID=A0AAN8ZNK6_9MAGN
MAEEKVALTKTFSTKPRLKPKSKKPSSSPESKYWAAFESSKISNLVYSINSIDFSPISPHNFAAAFSASFTLYDSQTLEPKSTFSPPKDVVAYSARFRSDGRLIAAGGNSGIVHVFDVKTRRSLRQLTGHTRAVRLSRYPRFDNLHLFSGGDDSLVKYWDVASETQIHEFRGHKDYVRCGFGSPVSSDLFVTGSYDHTIRLWDVRVSNSESGAMVFDHGKPVEDVVFLPSGGLVATAGGNVVKIWDVIGGGRLLYEMESHNKTVTGICVGTVGTDSGVESDQFRLLSVGLDGYMKVFDYSRLKVVHSMRFPAPLVSIGVSPDCTSRAIGTSNGIIFVGKRKRKVEEKEESDKGGFLSLGTVEPEKHVLKPTNFRYFHRGQGEKPSEGDFLVLRPKKVKQAEHDKLLRKFRHKEAFVSALKGKNPENVVAVMEELVARKKLLSSVSNMDKPELVLLFGFLQRYSTTPRYSGLLIGLAKKVLEMRVEDVNSSVVLSIEDVISSNVLKPADVISSGISKHADHIVSSKALEGGDVSLVDALKELGVEDVNLADVLKGHVRSLKRAVGEELRIQQSLQEIQGIISPLLRIAGRR